METGAGQIKPANTAYEDRKEDRKGSRCAYRDELYEVSHGEARARQTLIYTSVDNKLPQMIG